MNQFKLFFSMICFFPFAIFGQAPTIEWETNIGGDNWDECRSINETTDGGFILGGLSLSGVSGNKTAPSFGLYDYYVVKLNAQGQVEWEKSYGGSLREQCYKAMQTSDGGYILSGWSESLTDGNKTAPNYGERDCWVIKTDSEGNIEWQTTVGGNKNDYIFTCNLVSDGGYVFGGFSESDLSGNKAEPCYGTFDYFVFKLDADGNIVWQNTIGGSEEEKLHAIIETSDGGFFCGGTSGSDDGDHASVPKGGEDYWCLKLDADGEVVWDKSYGGLDVEELFDIHQDTEGNYILAGFTTSDGTGDVMEPIIGIQDGWALKLDPEGNIIWSNLIGGTLGDRLECAYVMNDGNYFMGSGSYSPASGDQLEDSYDWDYWMKKLDQATGEILWQTNLGGYGIDLPRTIIQTSDGSFVACGESTSGVGIEKTTPNYGNYDYWVIKLRCEEPLTWYADSDNDGYGNASDSFLSCTHYPGYVTNTTDCDDAQSTIYPGASELCNTIDDNCDGNIDEGVTETFYVDFDDDTYGNPYSYLDACEAPAGFTADASDCDDLNAEVYPGAEEIPNGIDDDCDELIDEAVAIQNIGSSAVHIYPNPVFETLYFETTFTESYTIELLDAKGALLLIYESSTKDAELNIKNYSAGLYTLKIIIGEQEIVKNILKE